MESRDILVVIENAAAVPQRNYVGIWRLEP